MKWKEDYVGIEPYFWVSILILAHTDINVPNVNKGSYRKESERFAEKI